MMGNLCEICDVLYETKKLYIYNRLMLSGNTYFLSIYNRNSNYVRHSIIICICSFCIDKMDNTSYDRILIPDHIPKKQHRQYIKLLIRKRINEKM